MARAAENWSAGADTGSGDGGSAACQPMSMATINVAAKANQRCIHLPFSASCRGEG